jgi:hypothetical protein
MCKVSARALPKVCTHIASCLGLRPLGGIFLRYHFNSCLGVIVVAKLFPKIGKAAFGNST